MHRAWRGNCPQRIDSAVLSAERLSALHTLHMRVMVMTLGMQCFAIMLRGSVHHWQHAPLNCQEHV